MLPLGEHRNRSAFAVDLGSYEGPVPGEVRDYAMSESALWCWRGLFLGALVLLCLTFWPTHIDRGEIGYLGLQQETISGNVEFISIDGETATGMLREGRWAVGNEIVVRGQPSPGEPGDESRRVNGFEATIPADTLESYATMAEMTGAEVRIIPEID